VWGHSEGGLVTQTVIEKEPHAYDGALPLCAPGAGGRRNLNAAGTCARRTKSFAPALRVGVPLQRLQRRQHAVPRRRRLSLGQSCGALEAAYPHEWGLTPECTEFLWKKPGDVPPEPRTIEFLGRRADACFGFSGPTPEQAARRSLFLRASRIPESFLITDLFFASAALGEIRNRRTGGGIPWSNDGVTYRSPLLTAAEEAAFNAGAPRAHQRHRCDAVPCSAPTSHGVTHRKQDPHPHALDDGLVLPENEEKYRELFDAVGRSDQLVQVYTPEGGHCGFSRAEHLALLKSMFAWVEQRTKPKTRPLSRRAARPQRRRSVDRVASRTPTPASSATAWSSDGRRASSSAPWCATGIRKTARRMRSAHHASTDARRNRRRNPNDRSTSSTVVDRRKHHLSSMRQLESW
jgi:hypothetical protein